MQCFDSDEAICRMAGFINNNNNNNNNNIIIIIIIIIRQATV